MGIWRRREQPENPAVHSVRTESLKDATYHIYRGPTRAQALVFLRQKPVTDPLLYVVVETPEGNVARDFIHIFDEPAGTPIEYGPRPSLSEPVPSTTHCAWCGFYIEPIDLSSLPDSVGTVQVCLTVQEVLSGGTGFRCKSCDLLQCGLCSDMATEAAESGVRAVQCRRCGTAMHSHLKLPPVMPWTYCLQVYAKDGHWGSLIDPHSRSRLPMFCAVVHAARSRLADVAQEQVFDKTRGFELPRRVVFFEGEPDSDLSFSDAYGVIEEGDSVVRPYTTEPPRRQHSKPEPDLPQAGTAAARRPVAAPEKQAEPLEGMHPAFRLKARMGKEAVIGLLGEPYRVRTARELHLDPARTSPEVGEIIDSSILEEEYWLYFAQDHHVEMIFQITFRSGALLSAELKSKDADWNETLLARIDQDGIAAAEPYRAALGAKQL
jgi:hypothetical protein